MKNLIILIGFVLSVSSYSKDIKYPAIVGTKLDKDNVIFKQCLDEDSCAVIGNKNGYSLSELNTSPTKRKWRAVGTGAVEGVAGTALAFFVGAKVGIGLMMTDFAAVTAGLGSAATVVGIPAAKIDAINPILQWKLANMEDTFHKEDFSKEDTIVIEYDDQVEMAKAQKVLGKMLANLEGNNDIVHNRSEVQVFDGARDAKEQTKTERDAGSRGSDQNK